MSIRHHISAGRSVWRLVLAAGILATMLTIGSASPTSAAPDTWSGSWTMTSGNGSATLTLTQSGSSISGTFEEGGSSTGVSGDISGNTVNGTFSGGDLSGTFTLVLSGTKLSGYYDATLFGQSFSGPLNGQCSAGDCQANGGSGAPAPNPSPSPPVAPPPGSGSQSTPDPIGSEQMILSSIQQDDPNSMPVLPEQAQTRGDALRGELEDLAGYSTPDELHMGALADIFGQLTELRDANNNPVYPALNAMAPVVLRMMVHAGTDRSYQDRASYLRATLQLMGYLVQFDTSAIASLGGNNR